MGGMGLVAARVSRVITPEKQVPVQLVDATPSKLIALCEGGVL
jgi:hypothetical protein